MLKNGRVAQVGSVVSGKVGKKKVTGIVVDIINEEVPAKGDVPAGTKTTLQVFPVPTSETVDLDPAETLLTEDADPEDRVTQ